MSQNGKPDDVRATEMPLWLVILVIAVMVLIAAAAFWHSARSSYDSLPRSRSSQTAP